ncbi:MAG TPA: cyclic-di-AMP receptor [Anaerolineales bacterium]|nr:cyclic-di-AMP receptor [Anaerolineales bacterium]
MKMIVVIVKDQEADGLTQTLTEGKFRVTRIASTGGFLRSGVATLLLGVNDDRVDAAIQAIREKLGANTSQEPRATLFVVPVERFEQV